jgi:hypothetical protein
VGCRARECVGCEGFPGRLPPPAPAASVGLTGLALVATGTTQRCTCCNGECARPCRRPPGSPSATTGTRSHAASVYSSWRAHLARTPPVDMLTSTVLLLRGSIIPAFAFPHACHRLFTGSAEGVLTAWSPSTLECIGARAQRSVVSMQCC